MKYSFLPILLSCLLFSTLSHSQSCVQGIINIYTPVQGFECDGNTVLVQNTTGFQAGDLVLLIQMQGAGCDLSNTAAFGEINQLNNAGNYEINRIAGLQGNKVLLQYQRTRNYDISGKVQLVRIPEYEDVNVCDLSCQPWNGTTGGVLILRAGGLVNMQGPIDVSGKGFRGGALNNNSGSPSNHETQFIYPPDPFFSAAKGEGITSIPANISYGRGKIANGGGGGNAHNSGGGGGGSLGGGGRGGTEFSHTVPNLNTFGIGGLSLAGSNDRVFMGGGGGAGNANDFVGSGGGDGGGIVIILAESIVSNGFSILANGENVAGGSANNDGQGGGGAGGMVAVYVNSISGSFNVQATGGKGGNSIFLQAPDQLIGPGGGGGGGGVILYHNTSGINSTLAGGVHGLANGNIAYGSQDGFSGAILSNISIPLDTILAGPQPDMTIVQPSCQGINDGSIQVTTTAASYTLEGVNNSTGFFNNLDTGTYTIFLVFSDGCEASGTAVLTAGTGLTQEFRYEICPGDSITLDGVTYHSFGSFTDTLPALEGGCDTVRIVHIMEAAFFLAYENYEICPGSSIIIDGVEIFEPVTVFDTIQNSAGTGCDTLLKKMVAWADSPQLSDTITFCPGDTVYVGTLAFTAPFLFTDTIPALVGCDTLRTTVGIWNEIPQLTHDTFLCPGEIVRIDDIVYTAPAEIYEILPAGIGCDTVLLHILRLYPLPSQHFLDTTATLCAGDPVVLRSPYPDAVWNDEVESEVFSVTMPGITTVLYPDEHGCRHRDTIRVKTCCNLETIYVPNVFSPGRDVAGNIFRINTSPFCVLHNLKIYNRWGGLLFQTDNPEVGWDGIYKGKYCEPGVYVWILETTESEGGKRTQLRGDVTITR
ncbi:MAG TPA: gliding motility-associated C-terminal domain-containing protein [Saprospiraceae bacterium]|nr:gliding motility-associated C-terminal domain-containing protein [Saprospiraceae bacterium]